VITQDHIEFARRQVNEVLNVPEFQPATLEERVQVLEDRDQIRDLMGRYAACIDARAWDELFEIFTDDIQRILLAQGHVVPSPDIYLSLTHEYIPGCIPNTTCIFPLLKPLSTMTWRVRARVC